VATEEEETAVGAVDFKSLRSQCAQIWIMKVDVKILQIATKWITIQKNS
jgi:hypothetical protein